jgi:DNA-binding MarR family transcriptional regulator
MPSVDIRETMDTQHTDTIRDALRTGAVKNARMVLMLMANYSRQGWRLGELSRITGLSAALISSIKEDLIKKSMAEEHYPERDKRGVRLYLTDYGREKAEELWAAVRSVARMEDAWRSSPTKD